MPILWYYDYHSFKVLDSNKEIDSDVEEALNNSNRIEELPDLTFVALDVVNVVSDLNDETASSPRLKRKNLLQKELPKIFTHNKSCECRLCLNTFLKQQLQKLSILSSFYFNVSITMKWLRCYAVAIVGAWVLLSNWTMCELRIGKGNGWLLICWWLIVEL